jgi:hypothetical protein
MDIPALELMEQTVIQLRDDGRASQQAWSFARRVSELSRGTVPGHQWQPLYQELSAYCRQMEAARAEPTADTDGRIGTLLCKGMNGDTQGMLRDLATLLLEAYRAALTQQAEATSKPL